MCACVSYFLLLGGSGLQSLFLGVESFSLLVFVIHTGGTKILGVLACRNLGM